MHLLGILVCSRTELICVGISSCKLLGEVVDATSGFSSALLATVSSEVLELVLSQSCESTFRLLGDDWLQLLRWWKVLFSELVLVDIIKALDAFVILS